MKLSRALLLSSKKQSEAWEFKATGSFFGIPLNRKMYRFLITDKRSSEKVLLFEIYCVRQEEADGKITNIVADLPHISEMFANLGDLHIFLHRFQITEEDWSPVEDS